MVEREQNRMSFFPSFFFFFFYTYPTDFTQNQAAFLSERKAFNQNNWLLCNQKGFHPGSNGFLLTPQLFFDNFGICYMLLVYHNPFIIVSLRLTVHRDLKLTCILQCVKERLISQEQRAVFYQYSLPQCQRKQRLYQRQR